MTPAEFRRLALAMPEAAEAPHFAFASFRVRGRIFATMPPDGLHAHLFVDETTRESTLALAADGVEALHWGGKVVGLRVALATATRATVVHLLDAAWRKKAPRALAAERAKAL